MLNDPNNATYLGDGVYASFDGWQMTLFIHDGYRVTNVIVINDTVMNAMIEFAKSHFEKGIINDQN